MKLLVLLFTFSLTLFLGSCSYLFYQPTRVLYVTPDRFDLNYEHVYLYSRDGTKLHGWHVRSKTKRKGVVLHFHGNAQNISSHFLNIGWLVLEGYDVLALDYRGYGKSEGVPDQKGVYEDALEMLNYAYKEVRGDEKFIVFSQSLGGVISLRALYDFPFKKRVDLLVLDSTFLSYQNIAFDKLWTTKILAPIAPLAYILVSDKMEAKSKISKLQIPILITHAKDDLIVPLKFGEEIYDLYEGKKDFWKFNGTGHGDIFWREEKVYRQKFLDHLSKL